jgi:apolipoprotein N-acyltransferase
MRRSGGATKPNAAQRPVVRALGVGTITGVLLALAYPEFSLWPLAFAAHVPLLVWLERDRPAWRHALFGGWLAGFVLHAVTYRFLAFTVREMSGLPPTVGWAVVVLYAAAHGLREGAFAWFVRTTARDGSGHWTGPVRRAGVIATGYAAIEFALPALFPWHLGNALYEAPVWMQAADLVGVAGVSLLCALVAALLAMTRVYPVWRNRLGVSVGAVLLVWSGYGLARMRQIDGVPATRVLRVAMVQGNATIGEKKSALAHVRLPMLDRQVRLTRGLDRAQYDLVVWPEGALPFFWVPDAVEGAAAEQERGLPTRANKLLVDTKRRMLHLVRELGLPLLFGSLRQADRLWRDDGHNSALIAWPDGRTFMYDKRILLAFGEYVPGSKLFPALRRAIAGVSHMEPGARSGRVDVAGVQLLVNICYEALFPAFLRREAGDADVIVNLTNDIWFGPDAAPELHLMVQQARAVELRRPLLRSTVTGVTAAVDARGVFQSKTELFREAIVPAHAAVRDLPSPYRLWGDTPMWLLCAFAAAWLVLQVRKRRT